MSDNLQGSPDRLPELPVDHALILHEDLESAERAVARLGFRATPRGEHGRQLGTANITIPFPDLATYLEVMSIVEPTSANEARRSHLEAKGSHLFGIAFKGDARLAHARFGAFGLADQDPIDFTRAVDAAGTSRTASFRIARMLPATIPDLYTFVCQHFTPELVWRDGFLEHPNTALRLSGLWGAAHDPAALAPAWRRLFGDRVILESQRLIVTAPNAEIRYLTPQAWADMFRIPPADGPAMLLAMETEVKSLAAAEAALRDAGVRFHRYEQRICVPDEMALGSHVVFREQQAPRGGL